MFHSKFPKGMAGAIKCFALLLLLLSAGMAAGQSDKKEKLQQQKVRLEDEIQLANKILKETRSNRELSVSQVEALEQKIRIRERLISTINREVDLLESNIRKREANIKELEAEIRTLKEDYAKMIRQAYKSRSIYSRMMFLLSSKNFNQALRRLEYMKQFAQFRRRQVEEIQRKQAELDEEVKRLEAEKTGKQQLLKTREAELEKLAVEKKEQEDAVAGLKSKEKEIQADIREKQKQKEKLDKEIQRIIAEEIRKAREAAARRKLEDEATTLGLIKGKDFTGGTSNKSLEKLIEDTRKKKNVKAGTPTASYELTPEARQLAANFEANKAKLPWPVDRGIIVGRFGRQNHPVAKSVIIDNKGVDIATEKGTEARAVFDGEVSSVIRIPGANIAVLIRHGNYFTVYNNLDEVYVNRGDKVTTKQKIGKVFTDPGEGKTVLHFELWKGDQVQDPQPWLFRN